MEVGDYIRDAAEAADAADAAESAEAAALQLTSPSYASKRKLRKLTRRFDDIVAWQKLVEEEFRRRQKHVNAAFRAVRATFFISLLGLFMVFVFSLLYTKTATAKVWDHLGVCPP